MCKQFRVPKTGFKTADAVEILVHGVESTSIESTYGIGPGVGHGKDALSDVGKAEIFVGELLSVN